MTSSEHTNLYMEVNSAQLRPALDMLAHALRSPLLDVSTISREVLAVDAEYSKNMHSDRWRIMQLVRRLADPRHPFARIGAGNYASLMAGASKADAARRLQLALRSFHATHYTAPNLVLSVVGPQDSACIAGADDCCMAMHIPTHMFVYMSIHMPIHMCMRMFIRMCIHMANAHVYAHV